MAVRPGYRSMAQGSAPGGTNVSVPLPAATRAGDWLIVFGAVDYGPSSNPEGAPSSGNVSDWLVRWVGFDTETNGLHFVIATMRSTADGARNVVFPNPSSASADCSYLVAVIDGATVDAQNPVTLPAGTESATAGTTLTAPAVTAPVNQSLALWGYALRAGPTSTIPAPIFTTTTNKLAEVSSRTYVTTSVYGLFLTATGTRAANAVSVKRSAVWAANTILVNGAPDAPTTPTAPKLSTVADRFNTLAASLWPLLTRAGHDAKRRALSIEATMTGGQPNYATARTAEAYSFLASTFSFRVVLAPSGGTVNGQAWVQQPFAAGVGRAGFELRTDAGATWLDLILQGADYVPLPGTVSLPYDQHVHRWLMLECTAAGDLAWYTSVDSVTWTSRRVLAAADVPAWIRTRNDLAASFEGHRVAGTSSGNVNVLVVDDLNLAAETPPTFTPQLTGGAALFTPNWSQPDNVAAGYENNPWQRQSRTSGMGDTAVPYPVPIGPAPFGRSGRAIAFPIPDDYRRYEVTPPTRYADGEWLWVGFSFLVEGDMDRVAQRGGYYQIVWQLHHAAESGSPPVGLEVRDSHLILAGGSNRPDPVTGATNTGNTYRYERYLASYGRVEPNRWIDVVLGIGMWSAINSGRLDVWVDGARHLEGYVPKCGTNLPGDGDLAYPKHGIYHDGSNRGCTVWFADYREGTSYAAVAPPAGKVGAYGDTIAEP